MNDSVLTGASTLQARLATLLPPAEFFVHSAPIFILIVGAFVALLVGVFRSDPERPNLPALGIATVSALAAVLIPWLRPVVNPTAYLGAGFLADQLSQYGFAVIALGTVATLLASNCTGVGRNLARPELVALVLLSASGMMMMVSAGEFLTFLVGLELASIPLYALVGFQRNSKEGLEASIKYFLLGSVATALVLMGAALLYLHSGGLSWAQWGKLHTSTQSPLLLLGFLLFVSGAAFKLALAPLHSWAPDVYEGSHSLLAGFMASLVKLAVVIPLMRIATSGLSDDSGFVSFLFWALGMVSVLWGSLFGVVQLTVKRILAYSSIANAGYFAIALAALVEDPLSATARQALVAYTGIYPILTLGSFAVLAWLEEDSAENLTRDNLRGLGRRAPLPAFLMTLFLFGLAGLPPLAGFFGKFWILESAVSAGFVGAAILIAITSGISLFYYLWLISLMWLHEPVNATPSGKLDATVARTMRLTVLALAAASIVFGIIGPRWALRLDYQTAKPAGTARVAPSPEKVHASHSF